MEKYAGAGSLVFVDSKKCLLQCALKGKEDLLESKRELCGRIKWFRALYILVIAFSEFKTVLRYICDTCSDVRIFVIVAHI